MWSMVVKRRRSPFTVLSTFLWSWALGSDWKDNLVSRVRVFSFRVFSFLNKGWLCSVLEWGAQIRASWGGGSASGQNAAGHLPRQVFQTCPSGQRPGGRPRTLERFYLSAGLGMTWYPDRGVGGSITHHHRHIVMIDEEGIKEADVAFSLN